MQLLPHHGSWLLLFKSCFVRIIISLVKADPRWSPSQLPLFSSFHVLHQICSIFIRSTGSWPALTYCLLRGNWNVSTQSPSGLKSEWPHTVYRWGSMPFFLMLQNLSFNCQRGFYQMKIFWFSCPFCNTFRAASPHLYLMPIFVPHFNC